MVGASMIVSKGPFFAFLNSRAWKEILVPPPPTSIEETRSSSPISSTSWTASPQEAERLRALRKGTGMSLTES